MPVLFVARSVKLGKWSSDVGLGKHVYKVGVSDVDPRPLAAAGWAGESDWKVIRSQDAGELGENSAIERLGRKERMIDPNLYPKLKGATGVFRVQASNVESHIIVSRALAGASDKPDLKLKPVDFADYLIHNAFR